MSKPIVNNSLENINAFKLRLETSRKYVQELLANVEYGEPEIVSGLDKIRQETAERIFKLQKQNGKIRRSEMEFNDVNRVREIQRKFNITFEEAMQRLVKNVVYQSVERQFAENYVFILRDVENILKNYGDELKVFPMNALSKESLAKLDSNEVGLSNTVKLRTILDTYVPDFMNLEIVTNDYSVVAKKYYSLSNQELQNLADEIKKEYADEDGKIDKIFAKENSKGLIKLLESLAYNNLTFEKFAIKYDLNYTRCYNMSSIDAVKQMVQSYYSKYHSFNNIKKNDQYLFTKLSTVRKQENMLSNQQLFSSWGLDISGMVTPTVVISDQDILDMHDKIKVLLANVYPDKIVKNNFSRNNKNLYTMIGKVSRRLGFSNIDSYLESIGYTRQSEIYRSTYKNMMCLSERDLIFYGFFYGVTDASEIENIMKNKNITLAEVENYAGFYTKLAYEKFDALNYANSKTKIKDED